MVADAPFPLGGTWNRDGVILFAPALGPLFRVSAEGGAVTPVTSLEQTYRDRVGAHAAPFFLPDGRHFFFVAGTGPFTGRVYVGSLDSKDIKMLPWTDSGAVYSPAGYALFRRESTLMAQPFDVTTLSPHGEAVPVAEGVGQSISMATVSVSDNGTLMYRPAVSSQTRLVWVSRTGVAEGSSLPAGDFGDISLSPDDKHVAFSRTAQATSDVWLTDLGRRTTSRFTFRPPVNNVPIWSPDGRQIVFACVREQDLDLCQRPSDASAPDTVFLKLGAPPILFPSDWSADGRFLAYYRSDPKTQLDIWTLGADRADERKPIPFLRGDFNESQPQFSPDGRWVAYVSDESGSQQVYVRSFLAVGGQRQISTDGGTQPRWRRDGKELFYLARDRKLMAVMVKTGATLEADLPRVLFQTELNVNALRQSYAVSANGQRFLLNTPSEVRPSSIIVVVNWTAALKK
jgi:dipeptidyl aminopeptidase/acylaminoacyl peptidase